MAARSSPSFTGRRPPRLILDTFFLPRGVFGRLGGHLMSRGAAQQSEIADLVRLGTAAEICEVGCGPGVLTSMLAERHPETRVAAVDPSPVMRAQAARRCRQAIGNGQVIIRDGSADAVPWPDGRFDTVVAVNNVVMWPDLDKGLAEVRRVLRPGGRLLLAWHATTSPVREQRRLALSSADVDALSVALRDVFGGVERQDLTYSSAWAALRAAADCRQRRQPPRSQWPRRSGPACIDTTPPTSVRFHEGPTRAGPPPVVYFSNGRAEQLRAPSGASLPLA